ncbi:SDR family NAD(P)-dependent oxidoreductase [Tianweitania sp. BSSL-BM11]|uniref:SDR family NAD(P)-dependent oxidoreductase n=1 Tax=Tianweitania aestuarii TaxID=2814886 RepID=A0ABS5RXT4_9HYPH|nr:SDR family NAD(P)-dependent oxidoreductase [Tianweitania aestuarii]MBS9721828.1 SDR family NAD(P)-dependent oxidoreductase [Tianweitania aestuarii]
MTQPLQPPRRKNPLERTRLPLLPPAKRSRRAHDLTRAAAEGRFALHACESCGTYSYPPREACPACLSDRLVLRDAPDGGELLSATKAEVPADNYFRERAPWSVGLVRMDGGPTVLCFLNPRCRPGDLVRLQLRLDRAGQAVFYAFPAGKGQAMSERELSEDPQWRELGADPQHRRILITDGRNPVLMPLVAALHGAGAGEIIIGLSESWKPFAHRDALAAMDKVTIVPLDLTDERSVIDLARDHAAKIEILINTADYLRPGPLGGASSLNAAREAMERLYFGQLRLAEAFAPVMIARGADGDAGAAAWVNLLSIYAQVHDPAYATYSGAQAAAVALSQGLRAELAKGGVRLANVFAGPTDSEWYQTSAQPKVSQSAIAAALVDALKRGMEETYVGDTAKDLHARKQRNPKALERELAAGLEG